MPDSNPGLTDSPLPCTATFREWLIHSEIISRTTPEDRIVVDESTTESHELEAFEPMPAVDTPYANYIRMGSRSSPSLILAYPIKIKQYEPQMNWSKLTDPPPPRFALLYPVPGGRYYIGGSDYEMNCRCIDASLRYRDDTKMKCLGTLSSLIKDLSNWRVHDASTGVPRGELDTKLIEYAPIYRMGMVAESAYYSILAKEPFDQQHADLWINQVRLAARKVLEVNCVLRDQPLSEMNGWAGCVARSDYEGHRRFSNTNNQIKMLISIVQENWTSELTKITGCDLLSMAYQVEPPETTRQEPTTQYRRTYARESQSPIQSPPSSSWEYTVVDPTIESPPVAQDRAATDHLSSEGRLEQIVATATEGTMTLENLILLAARITAQICGLREFETSGPAGGKYNVYFSTHRQAAVVTYTNSNGHAENLYSGPTPAESLRVFRQREESGVANPVPEVQF